MNKLVHMRFIIYIPNMKYKKGLLRNLCMVKCSGHYTKWKVLYTKPISN